MGQSPPRIHTAIPGAIGRAFVDRLSEVESPAFTQRRARRTEQSGASHDPIVWSEARGSNVVDVDGNVYVDLTAGFGVAAIGHGHPAVIEAVRAQSQRLMHALGDVHPSGPKIELLERLVSLGPWNEARAIFGLNGADAVTTALKTALLYTGRPGVLAFEGGYHGLGYGPLAATGYAPHFREPFIEQLNPHVTFAPWPRKSASVESALAGLAVDWSGIGAVLIEPVQGRGGVRVPPPGFLAALKDRCREEGAVFIADEIFTGLGRCGSWWRSVEEGAIPDLICAGKALGGGLPVSVCMGRSSVMSAWGDPGSEAIHTGTFFGNPLSSAAALATLDVLEQTDFMHQAKDKGETLVQTIRDADLPRVVEVRGAGFMIGIELDDGARALRVLRSLLERGYLVLCAGADASVIQIAPPFDIDHALLEGFVSALRDSLEQER